MSTFLRTATFLIWALWFGGVMGLFLSVQVLFHQTDRAIFLASAPRLFIAFEQYQLILAALALLLIFARRFISPARGLGTLLLLSTLATIGAIVEHTLITPRIEQMRIANQTHTPHFAQLHGLSMCVYLAVAITLLIAGIVQSRTLERPDFPLSV